MSQGQVSAPLRTHEVPGSQAGPEAVGNSEGVGRPGELCLASSESPGDDKGNGQ